MPVAKPQPRDANEADATIQANKAELKKQIAELRKAAEIKNKALRKIAAELREKDLREQRKRDNHAKILLGVAIIDRCQNSEASASKFKAFLAEFYANAPARLEAALSGLTLKVKKPGNDQERDIEDSADLAARTALNMAARKKGSATSTREHKPASVIVN